MGDTMTCLIPSLPSTIRLPLPGRMKVGGYLEHGMDEVGGVGDGWGIVIEPCWAQSLSGAVSNTE